MFLHISKSGDILTIPNELQATAAKRSLGKNNIAYPVFSRVIKEGAKRSFKNNKKTKLPFVFLLFTIF